MQVGVINIILSLFGNRYPLPENLIRVVEGLQGRAFWPQGYSVSAVGLEEAMMKVDEQWDQLKHGYTLGAYFKSF